MNLYKQISDLQQVIHVIMLVGEEYPGELQDYEDQIEDLYSLLNNDDET